MWRIRDEALSVLKSVYRLGDEIVVTGFSRGAAIARLFCAKVIEDGVNGRFPCIKFLGIFDTVFSLLPFGSFQNGSPFKDLNVSQFVKKVRHAVSIDEDRAAFAPKLVNNREGVVEKWFRGNHADVGGGYKERGLADITLDWMMEESGLVFKNKTNPSGAYVLHNEDIPKRRSKRRVGVKMGGKWSHKKALKHDYKNIEIKRAVDY